jgi:hypothetical protein
LSESFSFDFVCGLGVIHHLDIPSSLIASRFQTMETTYFHLFGLLALALRNSRHFERSLSNLDKLDELVFRTPARRFAWMVGLRLAGPRLPAAPPPQQRT